MEAKSKNITVAITPTAFTRARVWAAERNVSLSAVVGKFLNDLPQLRSARNFSKADLPRRVKKPRRATLYIQIEQPAHPPHSTVAPDPQIPEACVAATAPPANPAPPADTTNPISSLETLFACVPVSSQVQRPPQATNSTGCRTALLPDTIDRRAPQAAASQRPS